MTYGLRGRSRSGMLPRNKGKGDKVPRYQPLVLDLLRCYPKRLRVSDNCLGCSTWFSLDSSARWNFHTKQFSFSFFAQHTALHQAALGVLQQKSLDGQKQFNKRNGGRPRSLDPRFGSATQNDTKTTRTTQNPRIEKSEDGEPVCLAGPVPPLSQITAAPRRENCTTAPGATATKLQAAATHSAPRQQKQRNRVLGGALVPVHSSPSHPHSHSPGPSRTARLTTPQGEIREKPSRPKPHRNPHSRTQAAPFPHTREGDPLPCPAGSEESRNIQRRRQRKETATESRTGPLWDGMGMQIGGKQVSLRTDR